ncbi:MAG: hypothetical protein HN758_06330 [Verrucomicrobia bacterium]|nr:hypothetical protein [Verrucomicrobiota bacterium]
MIELKLKRKITKQAGVCFEPISGKQATVAMMQFARANAGMKTSSFRGMLDAVSIPEDPVIACGWKLNRTESCTIDCIEAKF